MERNVKQEPASDIKSCLNTPPYSVYFYLLDNTILLRGTMFSGSGQFVARGITVDASANIPVEKRCQEITMATGGGCGREVVD